MKKVILLFLASIICFAGLSACGKKEEVTNKNGVVFVEQGEYQDGKLGYTLGDLKFKYNKDELLIKEYGEQYDEKRSIAFYNPSDPNLALATVTCSINKSDASVKDINDAAIKYNGSSEQWIDLDLFLSLENFGINNTDKKTSFTLYNMYPSSKNIDQHTTYSISTIYGETYRTNEEIWSCILLAVDQMVGNDKFSKRYSYQALIAELEKQFVGVQDLTQGEIIQETPKTNKEKDYCIDTLGVIDGDTLAHGHHFLEYISNKFNIDIAFVCSTNNDESKNIDEFAQIIYDENGYSDNCLMFIIDSGTTEWTLFKKGNVSSLLNDDQFFDIAKKTVDTINGTSIATGLETYIKEVYFYFCKSLNISPVAIGEVDGIYIRDRKVEMSPGSKLLVSDKQNSEIVTGNYLLFCNSHGIIKVSDKSGNLIYNSYIPRTFTNQMKLSGHAGDTVYLPKESSNNSETDNTMKNIIENKQEEQLQIREMTTADYMELKKQGYVEYDEALKRWEELETQRVEELKTSLEQELTDYTFGQPRITGDWDDTDVEREYPTEIGDNYIYYSPLGIRLKEGDTIEFTGNAPLLIVGAGTYFDKTILNEPQNIQINKWLDSHGYNAEPIEEYDDEFDWRN